MAQQHTIKQKASISGIGPQTQQEVTLTFLPAPINHGICFKRMDLEVQSH
jgi:UDP-3-O-[3-hydroxymyristoyl] N-acetylglucosamine deacetylase/3-hydroxyacyl-[acyl-carrier-protein] dehydratase